jgi:DNA replication and repair protein RecF
VLTGPNGAGKTNLMEAVSFLSPGRGLRRAQLADVAQGRHAGRLRDPRDAGCATATVCHRNRHGAGRGRPAAGAHQRHKREKRDELLDLCRIIWLTPAMDGLFTGPASDRRRFLDRMVLAIDPAHGRRAADYEKAMRQRNRLLEDRPAARPTPG